MDIINYKIIECDRLSSEDVKILGIDADNKSSWRNVIKPIQLKKGDQINLEQVIISQKGADSNSIEFNGENQDGLRDNFSLLQVGFYLNNNGIHTLGLPFADKDDLSKRTTYHTNTYMSYTDENNNTYNVPSTSQGKANYQHPLPTTNYDNTDINLDKIISINPYQYIDSSKYAKIDPNYMGWERDIETGRRPLNYPKCNLMLEDIPLNLKAGFLNPNSIGDKLTLQLQRTLPAKDDIQTPNVNNGYDSDIMNDLEHPMPSLFNSNEQGVAHNPKKLLYTFNGYCYKSIRCNFNVKNHIQDPIYTNLCVSNPYKYVYGVRLIQDTNVYPQNTLTQDENGYDELMGTDDNIEQVNMRIYYPVFFFSNYLYNGNDSMDKNNWNIYSPKSSRIIGVGTTHILTLETTLNYSDTIDYDRIYRIPTTINDANIRYLVQENSQLKIRSNANIINDLGNEGKPIFYLNENPERYYLLIIWNAVPTLEKNDIWISEMNNKQIQLNNINFIDYYNNGVITISNNDLNYSWYLSFNDRAFTHGRIINTQRRIDANNLYIANFTLDDNYNINITTLTNNYDLPNVGLASLNILWKNSNNDLYNFVQYPTLQNYTITWLNPNKVIQYDFYIEAAVGTTPLTALKIYCKFDNRNKNDYETKNGVIIYTGIWYYQNNQNQVDKGVGKFKLENETITLIDNSNEPTIQKFIYDGKLYNFKNHKIIPKDDIKKIIPTGWTVINNSKNNPINDGNSIIYTKFEHLTKNQIKPTYYGDGTYSGVENGNYNLSNGDIATTILNNNVTLIEDRARLQKNQLLITNIKFTLENIKIIGDWMKYNKIYDGTKTKKSEILNDTENYYINVDIGRTSDYNINTNDQFNIYGVVPPYMLDKGRMGIDDGSGSENKGVTSVRAKSDYHTRQEIKIRSSFYDEYYDTTKIFYNGVIQDEYPTQINQGLYNYAYTAEKNEPPIKDLIDYCKEHNIGIIPLNNGNNIKQPANNECYYTCGFLVYDNYVRREILKIQNLTYFGFSPQFQDCPQVCPMSINQSPNYFSSPPSNGVDDMANMATNINIGCVNPTITFNINFSQYQISNFHTPMYQNELNSSADDAGRIVARLQDQTVNFTSFFQNRIDFDGSALKAGNPWGNSNLGINDSQSGIFINNIYSQKADVITDIISHEDNNSVEITPDNYYNSLWFKLGFTYFDLIPIKFIENDFKNRFYDLYYNNIDVLEYRKLAVKPFTTNSDIGIAESIGGNVFGYDASAGGTALTGKIAFSLGYNNNQEVALEVSSAFMSATSIPVQISTPYYRIYTNLPIDNLNYQNDRNNLQCIGLGLRNYASSSFYYSYAMSYNATITKDITITEIKTEIRTTDGVIARNLSDKSSVIYKITQQRTIGSAQPAPQVELLQKISDELKENNKIETKENFFERLKLEQAEMEDEDKVDSKLSEQEQQGVENLLYNLKLKIIKNIVNKSVVVATKKQRPSMRDINNAIRDIAKNLTNYFYSKTNDLRDVEKLFYKEGQNALNSKLVQNFIKKISGFMVNVQGDLVKSNTPLSIGTLDIDPLGSRMLLDKINNSINTEGRQELTTTLQKLVLDLFQDSQNIKIISGQKIFNPLDVRYKKGEKKIKLSDSLPNFLKDELKLKKNDIQKIMLNKNLTNLNRLYKKAQELAQEKKNDALRSPINTFLQILKNMGINISNEQKVKILGLIMKTMGDVASERAKKKEKLMQSIKTREKEKEKEKEKE